MGRKNLTTERQALILDAMEHCIVKYGLQGTTLENVADEAGINRGLIHHYVGNRNDVVQMMVERLFEKYQQSFDTFAAMQPDSSHADIVINYYFDTWLKLAPEDDAIILALFSESEREPQIQQVLRELYSRFENTIAKELAQFFPETKPERLHSVSYSLMLLAFSHAIMTWLGLAQSGSADVRSAAINLIQTLNNH